MPPDGFWNPEKQFGGIGAVLLRQHGQNLTYGTSLPDHLTAQLLTATDELLTKEQRNTQCELLAILAAILTWREELQGGTLLILSDSTAALGNLVSGSSVDDHNQQIVAQLLYLMVVHRIEFWVDWVPGKQNLGDPYSRPLTNSEDAKKLDELLHAKRCVLETFKDLSQEVVTTGYWPKQNITNSWYPHVSTIVQCICDAIAPTEGIFSIKVQLNNSNSSKGPEYMVAAIRITGTQVIIGRWTGTGYVTMLRADFLSPGRQMILHAGRSADTVPAPQRTQLVKAGFSLRNIP